MLNFIDDLRPAVKTTARIPFHRFVGDFATQCIQHRLADDIFGGDQLDVVPLPPLLGGNRIENLGVDNPAERFIEAAREAGIQAIRFEGVEPLRRSLENAGAL